MSSKEEALRRLDELEKNLLPRYEKEKARADEAESELAKIREEVKDLSAKAENYRLTLIDQQAKTKDIEDNLAKLRQVAKEFEVLDRFFTTLVDMRIQDRLKDSIRSLAETAVREVMSQTTTTGGGVTTTQTTLTNIRHEVKVKDEVKTAEFNTDTPRGKILWLASKGYFKEEWRTSKDVAAELEKRAKPVDEGITRLELANIAQLGYMSRVRRSDGYYYKVPDEGVRFIEADKEKSASSSGE